MRPGVGFGVATVPKNPSAGAGPALRSGRGAVASGEPRPGFRNPGRTRARRPDTPALRAGVPDPVGTHRPLSTTAGRHGLANPSRLRGTPDPDVFLPLDTSGPATRRVTTAKAICDRCPVLPACRTWALAHEAYGIWGGLTEHERARLRRTAAAAGDGPTGTARA